MGLVIPFFMWRNWSVEIKLHKRQHARQSRAGVWIHICWTANYCATLEDVSGLNLVRSWHSKYMCKILSHVHILWFSTITLQGIYLKDIYIYPRDDILWYKKDVLRLNINIKLWTLNNNDESVSVGSWINKYTTAVWNADSRGRCACVGMG